MTEDAEMQRQLLEQLAEIARNIEGHRAGIFILEDQQRRVREMLVASGWKPPT